MKKVIDNFGGEYSFLSNFYVALIMLDGKEWRTVEHYFQAQKTLDPEIREEIRLLKRPSEAKKKGNSIPIRKDWEAIKIYVMLKAIRAKFNQHKNLRDKLILTNFHELIEGNWWHDNTWGNCYCNLCKNTPGKNYLGKILMEVRKEEYLIETNIYENFKKEIDNETN